RETEVVIRTRESRTKSEADCGVPQKELAPGKVTPLWTPSCSHVEERPSGEVLGRSSETHPWPQQGACPSLRMWERWLSQRQARAAAGRGHLLGRVASPTDGPISTGFKHH
ncbi:unnamed protein product, partial [Gulo gulo]